MKRFLSLVFILLFAGSGFGQLKLSNSPITIDFDNTVQDSNNGSFNGICLTAGATTAGDLDSFTWSILVGGVGTGYGTNDCSLMVGSWSWPDDNDGERIYRTIAPSGTTAMGLSPVRNGGMLIVFIRIENNTPFFINSIDYGLRYGYNNSSGNSEVLTVSADGMTLTTSPNSPSSPADYSNFWTDVSGTYTPTFALAPGDISTFEIRVDWFGGNDCGQCGDDWFIDNITFSADLPPVVNKVFPAQAEPGTTVTLYGQNFNSVAAQNTVSFDAPGFSSTATVLNASSNALRVTVPSGYAGPVTVNVANNATALSSSSAYNFIMTGIPENNFEFQENTVVSGLSYEVTTAFDADNDGDIDIFAGHTAGNEIVWFENDGSGNFGAPINISTGDIKPISMTHGDVNADGFIDLIVSGEGSISLNEAMWYVNDVGSPRDFSAGMVIDNNGNTINDIKPLDVDLDGDLDMIAASIDTDQVGVIENVIGNFSPSSLITNIITSPQFLDVADITGDGILDVFVGGIGGWRHWAGNGDGTFTIGGIVGSASTAPASVLAADVDGDTDLDWIYSRGDQITMSNNCGGGGCVGAFGSLTPGFEDNPSAFPVRMAAADINGDGANEIIGVGNYGVAADPTQGGGYWWTLDNVAPASLSATPTQFLTEPGYSLDVADFDGDGDLDLLTALGSGGVKWHRNVFVPVLSATTQNNTSCITDDGFVSATVDESLNGGSATEVNGYTFNFYNGADTDAPLGQSMSSSFYANLAGGTYTVQAVRTSTGAITNSVTVVVNDAQSEPVVNTTQVNQTSCVGNNGSITADASHLGDTDPGFFTFDWYVGNGTINPFLDGTDGTISAPDGETISGLAAGDYTVVVTHNASGCIATQVVATVLDAPVAPTITITENSPQDQCSPANGSLTATVAKDSDTDPSLFTFAWYVGNGTAVPFLNGTHGDVAGTDGQTIVNAAAGDYTVVVTHKATGCSDQAIFVLSDETLCIANDIGAGLEDVDIGKAMWVDFTGDGLLDVAVTGRDQNGLEFMELYQNNLGTFATVSNSIGNLMNADMDWADFDNDGDMDIAINGIENGLRQTQVWKNDGASLFSNFSTGLAGLDNGSVSWVDYDNDGDEDLLIFGEAATGPNTAEVHLYNYNKTSDSFSEVFTNLPALTDTDLDWGDYDGDGDLDLLLTGLSSDYATATLDVFRNDGSGFFTDLQVMPSYFDASVAWGDLDNDGDLDAFITGDDISFRSRIYLNDGSDNWTDIDPGNPVTGLVDGDIELADFDNDGDLDMIGSGNDGTGIVTVIYLNESLTFVEKDNGFTGVELSSIDVADYDLDGDLDFLITGVDDIGFNNTLIYENTVSSPNNPPSIPAGLVSNVAGTRVTLSWNTSTDDISSTLRYNLRVGTQSGKEDLLGPEADLPTGLALKSGVANMDYNTSFAKDLNPGTYYWSVQAVDGANISSAFAPEESFTVAETIDLIISQAEAGNSRYYAGESTGLFFALSNTGNSSTLNKGVGGESSVPVRVYISDTPDPTGAIDLLYDDISSAGGLGPGMETFNVTVTIPSNYAAGTYYFVFEADWNNTFPEFDENDNVTAVPFEVIETSTVDPPNYNWTASWNAPGGDIAWAVAPDNFGNVIAVGRTGVGDVFKMDGDGTTSTLTTTVTNDIFVAKYAPDGTAIYSQTFGNALLPGIEMATGVAVDASDNIYISGIYVGNATLAQQGVTGRGSNDIFLIKLDKDFNTQWVKTFGSSSDDFASGIAVSNEGGVYVSGYFQSTMTVEGTTLNGDGLVNTFVVKYDNTGNLIYAIETGLGGNTYPTGIAANEVTGEVYICGNMDGTATFGADMLTSLGGNDGFVAKIDGSGLVAWARSGGGTGEDGARGIDWFEGVGGGYLYITGFFSGSAAFGSQTLVSAGIDMFLLKMDADGNDIASRQFVGSDATSFSLGEDVVADELSGEQVYLTGRFSGNVSTGNSSLSSPSGMDTFVTTLDFSLNEISTSQYGGTGFDVPRDIARPISSLNGVDVNRYFIAGQFGGTIDLNGTVHPGSGNAGALVIVASLDAAIADNTPPSFTNVNIAASTDTQSGSNPTVTVVDAESGVDIVSVSYSGISGKNADGQANLTNTSGDDYIWDVSGLLDFDPIGIEYTIRATDFAGNSDVFQGVIHRGYSDAEDLTIPFSHFGTTSEDYRMISIPLNLYNSGVKNTLEDDLGPYDASKWRIFRYSGSGFTEQDNGSFQAGRGYFLIVKESSLMIGDGAVLDAGSGVVPQTILKTEPYVLSLTTGWNQIANPYNFHVSWNEVLTNNGITNEIDAELYEFIGSNGYSPSQAMEPFKGYFVNANQNVNLSIPVTYDATLNGRITDENGTVDERFNVSGAWKLDLMLSSGNRSNSLAGIGMHPDALAKKDALDRRKLPRFIDYLDLEFESEEPLQLARNVMPIASEQKWTFKVANSQSEYETTISWNIQDIPEHFEQIILFDKVSNKRLPMRESNEYTFEGSERDFEILVGSEAFIQESLIPEMVLVTVFPNPSEGLLFFDLGIPDISGSEFVDVLIFNNTGKVIISERLNLKEGFHRVELDVEQASNQPLQPGMYVYRLKIGNLPGYSTGKIIIR